MALDQVAAASAASGGTSVSGAASAVASGSGSGLSFRSFLSDINPLQYVPVVGAVYRAVTGDEGNSTLRFVASLGTSFALGGPLGLGVTVAEKVTGIDPERIARSLLSRILHHGSTTTATTGAAATTAATGTALPATAGTAAGAATEAGTGGGDAANRPWSAAELSAYAARSGELSGATTGAGTVGADTLNAMELQRVSTLYA